jgi:molecular chaperone DnaK (HSP70)
MPITLGIDFGTSNSCCSYFNGKNYKLISNEQGNYIYPTILSFDPDSENILYSNSINDMALNVISNIKRLIGLSFEEYQEKLTKCEYIIEEMRIKVMYNNNIKLFTVNDIVVYYLEYLKLISENFTNEQIQDIVITVPVYFSDPQRAQLKFCCEKAGLNVIRMINEPTAAILAYYWDKINLEINKNILVIDCGGGTTDYSIINADLELGLFEVINVHGNNFLGGEDLTNNIYNYVIEKIYSKFQVTPNWLGDRKLSYIRKLCEKAKITLSYNQNVDIFIENVKGDNDFFIKISRSLFYSINSQIFRSIKQDLLNVTENLKIKIDEIIFVGGTTRIPIFLDICKEIFGNDVFINNTLNPDYTVSIGASIQGALLTGNTTTDCDLVLTDVTPMSLGIKTFDEKMSIVISKNTIIPASKSQLFTNSEDYINELTIEIYQGNNQFVKDNIYLGTFELGNLNNSLKRNKMKIEITFNINASGILSVSATDKSSNKTVEIVVNKYNNKNDSKKNLD